MLLSNNGMILPSQIATLGDRTPMLANGSYYGNSALQLSHMWAAYSELYRRQLWVGILVRKLAMATARMPFSVTAQQGNSMVAEAGPLADLLAQPNDKLSLFKMWQWVSSTYDIYGEAFLLKLRDQNGKVRELHPMHPQNVIVQRNADTAELEYLWVAGNRFGQLIPPIAWDDVIAFTSYSPDDLTRGISNLEGLRMTLLNEDASRRATASFWDKGARPSLILSHPKTLSDPAYARLTESTNARHGGADNAGSAMLAEEGMTVTVTQLNLEEMQYIESRKLNREEVCSAYDVPPPAVGILDHATFSNITEQLRSLYRDTMAPRFGMFESVINHQLVPDFYDRGEVVTKFNMDEVLRGDFETRATAIVGLVSAGVYKPSEARPLFSLPDAGPEADKLYANAALVPLGSNARTAQQVATDGTLIPQPLTYEPVPAAKGRPQLSARAIMGRLSRVKANKAETKAKLVQEHAKELGKFFDKQRDSVKAALGSKAAGIFDPTAWDTDLANVLSSLSTATSQAIGTKTASDLGGTYDPSRIADWLDTDAKASAKNINQTTATMLDARLATAQDDSTDEDYDPEDDVDGFFDEQANGRADQIATSRVAMLAGFVALVAAEQSGAATKTWVVTAANPRASHAVMDGETVDLNTPFSNGMDGPGDFTGGADEVAGCTCELEFNFSDNS